MTRTPTWIKRNAAIRAACAAHGIGEDARRDIVERVTGKRSLGACSDAEMGKVLRAVNNDAPTATYHPATKPSIRKIWALWGDLKRRGRLNAGDTNAALLSFVNARIARQPLSDPRQLDWLTVAEATPIIQALKSWAERPEKDHEPAT